MAGEKRPIEINGYSDALSTRNLFVVSVMIESMTTMMMIFITLRYHGKKGSIG